MRGTTDNAVRVSRRLLTRGPLRAIVAATVCAALLLTLTRPAPVHSAATLNTGDIILVDNFVQAVFRIDPVTGAQSFITTGGFLKRPAGVTIGPDRTIYVADSDCCESIPGPFPFEGRGGVIRVDPNTGAQTVVSFAGFFFEPELVAIEENGNLLVGDNLCCSPTSSQAFAAIIRVNQATGSQGILAAGGIINTPFSSMSGMTRASNGDLLVTLHISPGPDKIVRINTATGAQTAITPSPPLQVANGIAILPNGDLAVGDSQQRSVHRVNPTTGASSVISQGGVFDSIQDVAVDLDGNILVADESCCGGPGGGSGAVIRVNPRTGAQTVVSRQGSFVNPFGLAIVPPPQPRRSPDDDANKEDSKPKQTAEQRLQQSHTNTSNRDQYHTEGDVAAVERSADGQSLIVTIGLGRRESIEVVVACPNGTCPDIQPGNYLEVDGEQGGKEEGGRFTAEDITITR